MEYIIQTCQAAWNYKVSLIPVLFTYAIFDAQALYRRATKTHYVPIYFIVFPSGHSDKLYAEYYGEDHFFGTGSSLTESERKTLRRKIIVSAIISMVFAAVLAPFLCGVISSFYLSTQQFREFVTFLMIVKTIAIIRSLHSIRYESVVVGHGKEFMYVAVIYIGYLISIYYMLNSSFEWSTTTVEKSGYIGLAFEFGSLLYKEFFINIVVVTLLTWAVQQLITKPENKVPPADYSS